MGQRPADEQFRQPSIARQYMGAGERTPGCAWLISGGLRAFEAYTKALRDTGDKELH